MLTGKPAKSSYSDSDFTCSSLVVWADKDVFSAWDGSGDFKFTLPKVIIIENTKSGQQLIFHVNLSPIAIIVRHGLYTRVCALARAVQIADVRRNNE